MSDNETTISNSSINLMQMRMRERQASQSWRNINTAALDAQASLSTGFSDNYERLKFNGGHFQQDRMIFDKRRTLDEALYYSYQAADIQKVDQTTNTVNDTVIRALINPDKLKQNYDDKILSVHSEEGFKPGDVFEWVNTNTFWLIYLQDLEELAYFRGEIRRCRYQIDWKDESDTQHSTYAAIYGPVETRIEYLQKHDISVDRPNHSLTLLIPKTEDTLKYFKRYAKFYLQDEEIAASQVCWRIEAVDWVSVQGIIELTAVEYYSNEYEDDVENGIAGGLIVKPSEPAQTTPIYIEGKSFIKPKTLYTYEYTGFSTTGSNWSVAKKSPVKLSVHSDDARKVDITWTSAYSGQFVLTFGESEKTIVVESLF